MLNEEGGEKRRHTQGLVETVQEGLEACTVMEKYNKRNLKGPRRQRQTQFANDIGALRRMRTNL